MAQINDVLKLVEADIKISGPMNRFNAFLYPNIENLNKLTVNCLIFTVCRGIIVYIIKLVDFYHGSVLFVPMLF